MKKCLFFLSLFLIVSCIADVNQPLPLPAGADVNAPPAQDDANSVNTVLSEVIPVYIDSNELATNDANESVALPLRVLADIIDQNGVLIDDIILAQDTNEPNHTQHSTSALAIHALCADILSAYVNDNGFVDYTTLRRKRIELINVLDDYAALPAAEYALWSKEDKIAFWINAYNLCTLKAVVDNYPIQPSRFKVIFYPANSVMQLHKFWGKSEFNIMGETYNLVEMEQKVLRGQFDEPRICFALAYPCRGSPPLRKEPYYGKDLDKQLDDQAKRYLANDNGFKIDREGRIVYLSSVLQRYGADFLAKYKPSKQFSDKSPEEAAVLTYISGKISKKDAEWLARKMFSIKYIRFNWVLNEKE